MEEKQKQHDLEERRNKLKESLSSKKIEKLNQEIQALKSGVKRSHDQIDSEGQPSSEESPNKK